MNKFRDEKLSDLDGSFAFCELSDYLKIPRYRVVANYIVMNSISDIETDIGIDWNFGE